MKSSSSHHLPRRAIFALALSSGFAGALISAALTFGLQAWAENDNNAATDSVARAFSYNGHLEWDGEALNGPVEMTFGLYGAADATPDAALWSETQRLTAYNGRFGAELGAEPGNPITDTLYDAGALWLGIAVQRLDEGGQPLGETITLENKQKINPVPYALWSTQSSNLNVAGNTTTGGLTVAGNTTTGDLSVAGTTTTGSLSATGNTQTGSLNVSGETRSGSLNVSGHAHSGSWSTFGNATVLGNTELYGTARFFGGVSGTLLREASLGSVSNDSSNSNSFNVVQALGLGRRQAICVWRTTRINGSGGCNFELYEDQWRALAFGRATCDYTCYTWLP